MNSEVLDIKDTILKRDVKHITKNNYTPTLSGTMITLTIGHIYFYKSIEDAKHDFDILERFVRLQNSW